MESSGSKRLCDLPASLKKSKIKPVCQPPVTVKTTLRLSHNYNSVLLDLKHPNFLFPSQPWLNISIPSHFPPWNSRPRLFLLPVMKAFPMLISGVTSLELVTNPTWYGQLSESAAVHQWWSRAKLSCIFNPHKISHNCINEMTHKRIKRKDQLKQEKKLINKIRNKNKKFLFPEQS